LLSLSVDLLERLPVDPRSSGVRTAAAVGFLENVLSANLVPKSIEAEGWFSVAPRLIGTPRKRTISAREVDHGQEHEW
jgi:hypothetical protein